jgi:hypothetical protein
MVMGFECWEALEIFLFQNHPDWLWDTLSLLFKGYGASFMGEKLPGHKVDHSSPFTAEVENE